MEKHTFDSFVDRHIGPREDQIKDMLKLLGLNSLEDLVAKTVPNQIRLKSKLNLPNSRDEADVLSELKNIAAKNSVYKSYIGVGFYDCITPPVILRNIMENPGWYTQYTPYQAEISQGRLEALLNFQTMICDLTAMQISNASLLDEGTAAAEAMTMCYRAKGSDQKNKILVSADCHPHVIEVVQTRAEPMGLQAVVADINQTKIDGSYFAVILQYPNTEGKVVDYSSLTQQVHSNEALVIACADILALTLLTPPGEWGADIVVGNSQRFGVPLGFGGPHAAYMATKDEFKRDMPGRLIGVSKDADGKPALRLALQTREQHIRREKATSNICTAQVLLAVMAGMYAVFHGPDGLKKIARRVHAYTALFAAGIEKLGFKISNAYYFDTLKIDLGSKKAAILKAAYDQKINLRDYQGNFLGVALDETTRIDDIEQLLKIFNQNQALNFKVQELSTKDINFPASLVRKSEFLKAKVFNCYRSETDVLRYITKLQVRDLSLTTAMIPLGSCTMKLNATTEMIPVTWPEFGKIHPFAPSEQSLGYKVIFEQLESDLAEITGFAATSLQPNAGSQGEYAGLLVVRAFHLANKQPQRTVCLIPNSAHGTNPASAAMVGMEIIKVECDKNGNVDVTDLKNKAQEHKDRLACLMITYPSTHGVFEESIKDICQIIHQNGGQVYMDGANMNAQVGLCRPGDFGVDLCHLNLHKTFCIPHGGGGPGMGPICVAKHLAPFLPSHSLVKVGGEMGTGAVSSAPWGSASILLIPWVYIKLMGGEGLTKATQLAILNANYIAKRLEGHYEVLYRGTNGFIAHECILDCRWMKTTCGVEVADIAKRLMDYSFHAPTVSFPVVETLMVEPTESEPKAELDRFCEAMILIREEIKQIHEGKIDRQNNPLKNAPHTAQMIANAEWNYPYTRQQAAFPHESLHEYKFWPHVRRVDNVYGDRNLFCSCS